MYYSITNAQLASMDGWFVSYIEEMFGSPLEPEVEMKREHSRRVSELCRSLAAELEGWETGDINTAEAAGLIHDIGRFPQYLNYRTYVDRDSENHGELGYRAIREGAVFTEDLGIEHEPTVEAIADAVRYHNRKDVPRDLSEPSKLLLDLVRDCDKIDICRVVKMYDLEDRMAFLLPHLDRNYGVSPGVPAALKADRPPLVGELETRGDFLMLMLGWELVMNFEKAANVWVDKGLPEWILGRLEGSDAGNAASSILEKRNARLFQR